MVERQNNAMLSVDALRMGVKGFALRDITFSVAEGDYCIILGPTGAGKTLLLETLCGLYRPQSGRVVIAGRDVTGLDPAARNIGYVPQDYALYPFKTVAQNVAFGLEARRLGRDETRRAVDRVLELLGIEHLRQRRPGKLSGGERQRVALARALAFQPDVLLLDEPLCALDEATRDRVIDDLKQLHADQGTTVLHVCHNTEEALRLGHQCVVMQAGRIVQEGAMEQVLNAPASAFVARFLRLKGLVRGAIARRDGVAAFCLDGAPPWAMPQCTLSPGPAYAFFPMQEVTVTLQRPEPEPDTLLLEGTIETNMARRGRCELRLNGPTRLRVPGIYPPATWTEGRCVYLSIPREKVRLLPDESNHR